MSGHNKWSTIKRKKGALDAKRSKIFSRIVKEIAIAVKEGGPVAENNPRLRVALQNAKGANMPKATVEKALSKASASNENYEEITFEAYGHGGVAIFIECLSDNNNRTVSNVRAILNKRGGTLSTKGSLSFIFERKGIFTVPAANIKNFEEIELELIDAGAEDIENIDDKYIITTKFEDFGAMQKKLEELSIEPESQELERVAITTKEVDLETAQKNLKLIEALEEEEDVEKVFHNMEMTEEIQKALETTE